MIRTLATREDAQYVYDIHWKTYTEEFNYDPAFIAFFTEPILIFARGINPDVENMWILVVDNKPAGTITIKKVDEETAQLRWFLLEVESRGKGYGKQLLETAIAFCREKSYKRIFLWTNNILETARGMYAEKGFTIIKVKDQHSDSEIIEEKWELRLDR